MRRAGIGRRGFTLIELMITVAIIGVLAVLATVGYARWTRSAKTGEATSTIALFKGAQESYRAESLRYLDVSGGNINLYYPLSAPTDQKAPWNPAACKGTPICDNIRILGVNADAQVYYRYSSIAGPADGAVRVVDGHTFPAANDPWYVVKAQGNLNNDSTLSAFWSSSFDGTVWSRNPDE